MIPLCEKYRPNSWGDVVGQDKVIAKIMALARRGLGGRAYWLSGQSGTGKTTIARLIAQVIADEQNIIELDASQCTAAFLRQVEGDMAYMGMGSRHGKAYLINEAHGLRSDAIRQLLVLIERLPDHVAVVFTTTSDGQDRLFEDQIDAHPLLSRCIVLPLARRDICEPLARRAREIAVSEGLDGKPFAEYVKLLRLHKNNLRAAIQDIETGAMMD